MLFFLRKIRKKLVKENKLVTYLLYSIGEIILVVIGILIAISIDDWNQEREIQKIINTYLINLESELNQNRTLLMEMIENNQNTIDAGRHMLDIIAHDSIQFTNKELSGWLGEAFAPNIRFQPVTTVLTELASSGNIKNVRNEDLKKSLSTLTPLLAEVRFQEDVVWQDKELGIDELRKTGSLRELFDHSGASAIYLKILPGATNNGNKPLLRSKIFENNLMLFVASSTALQSQYNSTLTEIDSLSSLIKPQITR